MGQVPKKTYGVVGAGKTAKHIKYYFQCLNILIKSWARSDNINSVEETLYDCDVVLLLIKDSEIESFLKEHDFLRAKQVVHLSGSLVIDNIQSAHPLMTFGDQLYSLETYKKISFICEKHKTPFREIFPELENSYYEIESHLKPFYHSLCVMSGNFTTILWQKFFYELVKLKIPPEAAIIYLDKIVDNLKLNPNHALTGPLARRDKNTISKNIESLAGDSFQKIYKSFVEAYDNRTEMRP